MDPKPHHRSLRTLRVRADENDLSFYPTSSSHIGKENIIPSSKASTTAGAGAAISNGKSILPSQQQRNRSATALSSLSSNISAVNLVVKRTAFGDVSNTVSTITGGGSNGQNIRRSKDDSSILKSTVTSVIPIDDEEGKKQKKACGPRDQGCTTTTTTSSSRPSAVGEQMPVTAGSTKLSIPATTNTTTTATSIDGSKPPIPTKSSARQTNVYRDPTTDTKTAGGDDGVVAGKQQLSQQKSTENGTTTATTSTTNAVEECKERRDKKDDAKITHRINAVRDEATNHNTDVELRNQGDGKTIERQQQHDTTTNQKQAAGFRDVDVNDVSDVESSSSVIGSESSGITVTGFVDHIDVDAKSEEEEDEEEDSRQDYDSEDEGHEDGCYVDAVQNVNDDVVPTPGDVSMQSPDAITSSSAHVAALEHIDISSTTEMCSDDDHHEYSDENVSDKRAEQQHQQQQQSEEQRTRLDASACGDGRGGVDNTATMVLYPEVNERSKREIAAAKQIVETTRTPEIDDECWDVTMVTEYGDDIFEYMREMENKLLPNPHYMDNQTEIQWSMRSVLMDWIVQVHLRFNLIPETLFLTVNYIDRFLSSKVVSLGKLQLVGATAIFIASKYEEVTCPSLAEIIYMVDNTYTAEEILKAERFMLAMLQFELGWPGPMSFLRRISKADEYDYDTRTLAKYLLEVTIMDERFVGAPASFLAAGAHCLARLMLRKGTWTPAHIHYSGYTYAQLHPVLLLLLDCVDQARTHHPSVQEKYSHRRYKRASCFVEGEMAKGFKIPIPDMPRDEVSMMTGVTSAWEKRMKEFAPVGEVVIAQQ